MTNESEVKDPVGEAGTANDLLTQIETAFASTFARLETARVARDRVLENRGTWLDREQDLKAEKAEAIEKVREAVVGGEMVEISRRNRNAQCVQNRIEETARVVTMLPDPAPEIAAVKSLERALGRAIGRWLQEYNTVAAVPIIDALRQAATLHQQHKATIRGLLTALNAKYGIRPERVESEPNYRLRRCRSEHPLPGLIRALRHEHLAWFINEGGQGQESSPPTSVAEQAPELIPETSEAQQPGPPAAADSADDQVTPETELPGPGETPGEQSQFSKGE